VIGSVKNREKRVSCSSNAFVFCARAQLCVLRACAPLCFARVRTVRFLKCSFNVTEESFGGWVLQRKGKPVVRRGRKARDLE
jgi:hypothetical protein